MGLTELPTVPRAEIKLILGEVMRGELERIIALSATLKEKTLEEMDARIATLEAENKTLKCAARLQDWAPVEELLRTAARSIGLTLSSSTEDSASRQALKLKQQINQTEIGILEGEDIEEAAKELKRHNEVQTLRA